MLMMNLLCGAKMAHSPLAALSPVFSLYCHHHGPRKRTAQPFGRSLARPQGEDHGRPVSNPWLFGLFLYRALLNNTHYLKKAWLLLDTIPLSATGSWLRCDLADCLETRRSIMRKLLSSRRTAASTQAVVMFSSSA